MDHQESLNTLRRCWSKELERLMPLGPHSTELFNKIDRALLIKIYDRMVPKNRNTLQELVWFYYGPGDWCMIPLQSYIDWWEKNKE